MRTLFTLLISAVISFSAHASADNFDIYINDDGVSCMLLIDVASLKINPTESQQPAVQQKIREYLVTALKTVDQRKCASPAWEAKAIIVGKRDPYGQPDWSDVISLQQFQVNSKKLQAIKNKKVTQADINQVIALKEKG